MTEQPSGDLLLYRTRDGAVRVNVLYRDESFWMPQKAIAELFGVKVPAIAKHLKNIYEAGELDREATVSKMEIVQTEGVREVTREVEFYNLDAIIAVGYRVNSYQATQFRIWTTRTLKEYVVKGFVLDDERLKQGRSFGTWIQDRRTDMNWSQRIVFISMGCMENARKVKTITLRGCRL